MEKLIALLFPAEGPKTLDIMFFEGEQKVQIAEFCEEAHAAFVQVNSGQAICAASFPENLTRLTVDKFLNGAC